MMARTVLAAVAVCAVLLPAHVLAVNSVVVETKAIGALASNAPIRIRITNDETLVRVDVPLEIRSVTPGCFITSMRLTYGERLPLGGPLNSVIINNQYATANGSCKTGGFGTVTFSDGLTHPVTSSPEGALFSRTSFFAANNLSAGADVSGSLILLVNANATLGTFEIDTTCTDPSRHLEFEGTDENWFTPAFTKGVITIATDTDGDGIPDVSDNCPFVANNNQFNLDGDAFGDACDTLRLTAYSPVDLVAVSPDGSDSIGPGFNTLGSTASYDSTTDRGLGPNNVPGEADDQILILEPQTGQYTVKVVPESGASGNYFMGVRDPGGNFDGFVDVDASTFAMSGEDQNDPSIIHWQSRSAAIADATALAGCVNSQASYSATPIANPVPAPGQFHSFTVLVAPQRRGDLDGNHIFDIVDVVLMVNVAFRGANAPSPPGIADANGDCISSDIQDVVRIIGLALRGQPETGP